MTFKLRVSLSLLLLQALQVRSRLPSSSPHVYPDQPDSDYGPEWQDYFEVKDPLPDITFPLSRSFAGNLPVSRNGLPDNNTLFFWGFEKDEGSLTSEDSDEPWGIWLNGGPGTSSLYGLFFENGPIRIGPDYGVESNEYSWDKLADYFWIDQPVGVGYATVEEDGYVADEDQVGSDFMGFLGNLVKVFPSLATRPLHLSGESYAGTYIPYIMKAYFGLENPPVNIASFVIGDGTMTSAQVFQLLPALSVIETFPQIIGYDPEVYKYFKAQSHLCGYDLNLTYPQDGPLPSVPLVLPTGREVIFAKKSNQLSSMSLTAEIAKRYAEREDAGENDALSVHSRRKREELHEEWKVKRDLSGLANGTLDPWYGCLLLDMFVEYALNFTYPWNINKDSGMFFYGFDIYDIPSALAPKVNQDASVFMNDDRIRAALHAPTSKDWEFTTDFAFGELGYADPSPEPMVFFSELASNASEKDVSVVLYAGNDDALIAHRSTDVTIQNTTFGGIQGFTKKPSTPWYDDDEKFAGIVHQERGWTYVLFYGSSHMVPAKTPQAAFKFLREFVLGDNPTGRVNEDSSVVGGQDPTLEDILLGAPEVYYGEGKTEGTYVFPTATIEAWKAFIQTETQTASAGAQFFASNTAILHAHVSVLAVALAAGLTMIM